MKTIPTLWLAALAAPLVLLNFTSCSSHHPTAAPYTTQISPGQLPDDTNFGGEVAVNSFTGTATVVSMDARQLQIVLKRPDGTLLRCHACPGIVSFGDLKVSDAVTIGIAEELALSLGEAGLPASSTTDALRIHVRTPDGVKPLAEGVNIVAFTAKIVSIDDWKDAVTLRMDNGNMRTVRVSEAVNLADVHPGDEVSVRLTDSVVLIGKGDSRKE
jgi:hypothetical protein